MTLYTSGLLLFFVCAVLCDPITIKIDNPARTKVTAKNIAAGEIGYKLLDKPHHLFIGRCNNKDFILHEENIILTNDGKSHVSAKVRMNVDGAVYITCVNVYDEAANGEGGYPHSPNGGVGLNFVEFEVMTSYGKGFQFFVQIYGQPASEETKHY